MSVSFWARCAERGREVSEVAGGSSSFPRFFIVYADLLILYIDVRYYET